MNSSNNLRAYNTKLFEAMFRTFNHFQVGFFNGNDILFVGQNPGRPFDSATRAATQYVQMSSNYNKHVDAYEKMIIGSKIGKYLAPVINGEWDRVSFTNTVKVSTPDNSLPTLEQYEQFFPILMKQIELLQPKVIVCLGKYAGSVFGLDKFYEARRYNGSVVCMYPHSAFVLRQGRDATLNEQVKMKLSIEELLVWSESAKREYAESI